VKVVPIRRHLGRQVFEPELIKAMSEAFAFCCDYFKLNVKSNDAVTRRVAEAVIAAAKDGESDVEGLFEGAMKRLNVNLN
jgi:hypothetical protein